MSKAAAFELVRLAGAEIDDQAIAEIIGLLRCGPEAAHATPSGLIRLAARGPLVVARRPCGESPEIVAVAGWAMDADGFDTPRAVIGLDPKHAGAELVPSLRSALLAQPPSPSLFRGRDKAPLGLYARRA